MAKKEETKKNTKKKEVKKVEPKKENKVKTEKTKEEVKKEESKKVKVEKVKSKKSADDKYMEVVNFLDKYKLLIFGALGGILVTTLVAVIIWPDRIATLKDGTQPVVKIDGLTMTADDLYTDMKEIYSISSLLDKIDNKILEKKYPDSDEMKNKIEEQADQYYKMYEQYYKMDKETFLSNNGFASEKKFLEYLKLNYRRTTYAKEYVKTLITDKEVDKYYEDKVYGDINTKHMLVKVDSSASDEDKKAAENKAKEIIKKLDEGKSFDEVKEEYKDEVTYEELGYKSYDAALEEAYLKEMIKLGKDEYSKEPVKTSYGYHIVYKIDQKEKPKLEDVKDKIIDSLVETKMSEDAKLNYVALDKMRKEANINFSDKDL